MKIPIVVVCMIMTSWTAAGLSLQGTLNATHNTFRNTIMRGHSFLNPTLLKYSNDPGRQFARRSIETMPMSLADNHYFDEMSASTTPNSTFAYDETNADDESLEFPANCNYSNCLNWNDTCEDSLPCNITKEEYMEILYSFVFPNGLQVILIFSHFIVFITGLVGNALVCIAVYTNYSMRTVTNIFIVNLAVADFIVILVCLPPSVVWDVTKTWFLGNTMCKVVSYFQSVSVTVSVLTLTFISVDRWYAICFPLRYRTKISRAIGSVAFIWIVALVMYVPEFMALKAVPYENLRYETVLFTQCKTTWDFKTETNFYLARFVVLYVLPLFLMMLAYFKIVRVLWKSDTIPGHRESRNHTYSCAGRTDVRGSGMPASNSSTMGQLQARRKAAKMLVSVVVMFAVCFFPVHIFNILRYTQNLENGSLTNILSLGSHWLCYANSAVNPVIYNFMSGKFRKEFRNALEKCRCGRARVEDRFLNHSNPASRLNNVSPSTRTHYHLTSVRDITRDVSRQTMQTTFIENGNSATTPMIVSSGKDPNL